MATAQHQVRSGTATAQHSVLASGQLVSRRLQGGAVTWAPFLLGVGRRDLDPRLTTVLTTFVL